MVHSKDAEAIEAFVALIARQKYIFTARDLAEEARFAVPTARKAIDRWLDRGWLEESILSVGMSAPYVVTAEAPTAPSDAAIQAVALLQVIPSTKTLLYGYGTALGLHGMSAVVQSDRVYIWQLDERVRVPNIPDAEAQPFVRSKNTPQPWARWKQRDVYVMRRHEDNVPRMSRDTIAYQGASVPCTSIVQTLYDCWLRPDYAGGFDRVESVWREYLHSLSDGRSLVADLVAIVVRSTDRRQDLRIQLKQFIATLGQGIAPESDAWAGV